MDGKGRATDNAFINPAADGLELYQGIANFIFKYNRRHQQGIDRQKPINL
jgi:putative transposase